MMEACPVLTHSPPAFRRFPLSPSLTLQQPAATTPAALPSALPVTTDAEFPQHRRRASSSQHPRHSFSPPLPLHSKNPTAIYRDLKRLAREGNLREALSVLDYLNRRGVPVSATAFSSLLSACARARALSETRRIHAHVRANGLENNEFIQARLVQTYASCGSPDDARAVFADQPPQSVYPWNALLRGNVVGGGRWSHGALDVFGEMREAGVEMNEYSFSCLIKSLAGSPSAIQGMKAHALLLKKGFLGGSSLILTTSMIDMYFKCNKVRQAMKLFDEIPEKDIVGWGAVIAGFAHNGMKREALEYFRWMRSEGIEPNSVILVSVLPVIGELSELRLGKEIHVFALKHFGNFSSHQFIQSGLIDMYSKCGDLGSARRIFYGTSKRNIVLWTSLMSGYVSNGRLDQALRSVIWMQQEGIKPDIVTVATALPVCAKLRAHKTGKELHAFALKHLFFPNISITTSLMIVYSCSGNLAYSSRLFDMTERKNIVMWTAMMDSCIKNGQPLDALAVFRSMQLSKHRPDSVAMARGLSASRDLQALKLGKEIHGQVLRRKLEWVPFVLAELIGMYGRCAELPLAKRVFDGVSSKGSLTWTSIIEAYALNGLYHDAIDLFRQMLSDKFIPNLFLFDIMLSICRNAELADEALEVFNTLVRKYDLKPSREHYDCIIELLDRAGRQEEVQRFSQLRLSVLS